MAAAPIDKPRQGFMLGKFLPPTEGHRYLGDFAASYCSRLDILVGTMPHEPIPGRLRHEWMKEMFPRANVFWCDEVLPQDPSETPDFWQIWKDVVARHSSGPPDVVFASEHYGHRLAAEVGARFVPVDISRTCRPVSGTAVRSNPMAHWSYIPLPVRPYFCRRVTLFGPESSGKSTLASAIGEHFRTIVVPEYGRIHVDAFGDPEPADLHLIAAGHRASVTAAMRQANRFVVEDTDPALTSVWSEMLHGRPEPEISGQAPDPDLYILCDIDIPWVGDGQRYFPQDADRRRFFDLCHAELRRRNAPYVVVAGTLEQRLETAAAAIERLVLAR